MSAALISGCAFGARDAAPRYDTEADCETANPGQRCDVIMCDYKCPRNYAGNGWIAVGDARPTGG